MVFVVRIWAFVLFAILSIHLWARLCLFISSFHLNNKSVFFEQQAKKWKSCQHNREQMMKKWFCFQPFELVLITCLIIIHGKQFISKYLERYKHSPLIFEIVVVNIAAECLWRLMYKKQQQQRNLYNAKDNVMMKKKKQSTHK